MLNSFQDQDLVQVEIWVEIDNKNERSRINIPPEFLALFTISNICVKESISFPSISDQFEISIYYALPGKRLSYHAVTVETQ